MATEETLVHDEVEEKGGGLWSGGKSPFGTSYGKLMMWYFLLSDAFTFAGFLIAYGTLRFSSPTWPVPDVVFATAPFGIHEHFTWWDGHAPLLFVTFMSFLLIISSVTMVRAVQEGHRENLRGVAFWMLLTIIGGAGFLGCQAWEWSNLINKEFMTVNANPFGTHIHNGEFLGEDGKPSGETFEIGDGYLIHNVDAAHADHGDDAHGGYGGSAGFHPKVITKGSDMPGYLVNDDGFIQRKYVVKDGDDAGKVYTQAMGPKAFGALFFFITGFHGFHVFSGLVFLTIIMINVMSGLYVARKNGYEMVEKIGLYWHFVDLVWVFVFLVFYLL